MVSEPLKMPLFTTETPTVNMHLYEPKKWIPWMGFIVNELFLYEIYQYLFWKVASENVYFSKYTEHD